MKTRLLCLLLALCLSVPAAAGEAEAAGGQGVLSAFTICRNGSVDEKEEAYRLPIPAQLLNGAAGEESPAVRTFSAISKNDVWTITHTGGEASPLSGGGYELTVALHTYFREDGRYVNESAGWWWGDKGRFVEEALEAGEDGSQVLRLRAGESTHIPASAFLLESDVGADLDPIYELRIQLRSAGDSPGGTAGSYSFYFSLDESMKDLVDSAAASKPPFPDVKPGDYFADAVTWAAEKEIVSVAGDTPFSPGLACTAAQLVTLLYRAGGSPEPAALNPFAEDAADTGYSDKAALWAAEKGMASGDAFDPDAGCTRATMVEYLWKALGSPAPAGRGGFPDVPEGAGYADAVAWAAEAGIVSGVGGGRFAPDAACTRGQLLTLLYRAFGG